MRPPSRWLSGPFSRLAPPSPSRSPGRVWWQISSSPSSARRRMPRPPRLYSGITRKGRSMQRRSAICRVATALALAPFSAAAQNPPQEPLCRAALNGDAAEVRRLLDRGVDPDIRDEDGYTPLLRATEITRYGLADEKRPTPDYQAVAALLLARRASVNARTPAGRTPLLGATRGSASEYRVIGADAAMVRLLIDQGADLNAHDNEGWTALLQVSGLWA